MARPPVSKGPHRLTAIGGALLFLGVLIAVEARSGAPLGIDLRAQLLAKACRAAIPTQAAKILNVVGRSTLNAVYGFLLFLYAYAKRDKAMASVAAGATAGLILWTEALKVAVARPRPDAALRLVDASGGSFPSGHALGSTCICLLACALLRRHGRPGALRGLLLAGLVLVPIGMGLSRVYLGVHHLSDVIASGALGMAWFSTCVLFWG